MAKRNLQVCMSPALFDLYADRKSIVVVVDVLRATSTMCIAFEKGIEKMIQILREEIIRSMKLLGVTRLDQLNSSYMNINDLERHITSVPIPPSPYVYKAPITGVRSPSFPQNMSIKDLK